jgi:hypothetical protein
VPKEYACLLFVDFLFNENECIAWSDEEEIEFNTWLKKESKNISQTGKLNRKIQNRYRLFFISVAAERMQTQYKVIFANMPFPKHLSKYGKNRYKACAVKDNSILPQPPYKQSEN